MDYGCGPCSALVAVTDRCEVNEDDQDCEDEAGDEDGDNESYGDGDVQVDGHVPLFLTINQLMESEQGRYLSVDVPSCDVLLGYGQNIQSSWNINAAEFIIFIP